MKTRMNHRGVTLLELILAIGLVAIIAGAGYTVLLTGVKTFNTNVDNSTSQSGLRSAMMQITRDAKKATAVAAGGTSLTLTIGGANHTYTTFDGNLLYNGKLAAQGIKSLTAVFNTTSKILTVTLTASDDNELSSQMYIN